MKGLYLEQRKAMLSSDFSREDVALKIDNSDICIKQIQHCFLWRNCCQMVEMLEVQ